MAALDILIESFDGVNELRMLLDQEAAIIPETHSKRRAVNSGAC